MHQAGDIILQKYQIGDVLGQGGVGITYAAKDLNTGENVAIKALSLHHITDWKILQLFEREAKTLAQLNHPAIPRYIDYFEIDTPENRAYYIVQQQAPGKSFADLVATGWRTSEREVRKIAAQVLDILIYLHNLTPPIFHRDIKPQNLIYDKQQVYLVDFGAVTNTYQNTVARGSTVVGTYGYMAPEQFRGQTVAATDLYGLGATLLFLLSHRSPAELPQERLKISFRACVQVSEHFAAWLEKILEPDIEQRFSSAKIALVALKRRQIAFDENQIKNSLRTSGIVLSITIAFGIYAYFYRWQVWGWLRHFPPDVCSSEVPNLVINDYLKHGGNMYALTDEGQVILDCWLRNDYLSEEVMQLIISKLADINQKDYYGHAALHIIKSQRWANLFIKKGADINIKDKGQQVPLHSAYTKSIELVKSLIVQGADINARDAQAKTPLHTLLESFAGTDKPSGKEIALVKLLMKHGAKMNPNFQDELGQTFLHKVKSVELARLIIANGVDINIKDKSNNTALHLAVFRQDYELVDLLLQHGANANILNGEKKLPINLAIDIGYSGATYNVKVAKLLINKGADVNTRHPIGNLSLLHLAVRANDRDFINFLLNKGADVNIKSEDNFTPLHSIMMVFNEESKISLLLVERGADVNIKNSNGETALDIAKRMCKRDVLNYLRKKGVNAACE
jgi:serine/threonine protein kinase